MSDICPGCFALSERNKALEAELSEAKRELACPCCKEGISITGQICQECHGKGLVSIAYESCRIHYKLLKEKFDEQSKALAELAKCRLKWQTGIIPADGWYWRCWINEGKRLDIMIAYRRANDRLPPDMEWAGPIPLPEEDL